MFNLKKLDSIRYKGSRLILGAFITSPIDNQYAEANEVPLQLRCEKLVLQYYTKLKSYPSNPAHDCTFNPKYNQCFEKKEKSIKHFSLRTEPTIKESKISLANDT